MSYRMLVIYEIEGDDRDEAQAKLDKLERAAKRIGLPTGFIDAAGEAPDLKGGA